jgi:hypothetical protein
MPNYPLLPPLKGDKTVGPLPNTGHWQSVNAVTLDNISRSLKVTSAAAKFTDIDSIPSMWARPLLFEMALYDADHPMRECILGEWRGLLAMLALKERKNFPLTTKQIAIPDGDDNNIPEFLRALRKLLPEHTLEASTTWDKLYLILFNGKPIGMTSPTTLLCTSIDYTDYISNVSWFDGQFLCDPIASLDQEERAAVAGWLTHFHETQIAPLPDANPNLNEELNDRIKFIRDRLNGRILDFRNELGGSPISQPKFSDTGLGMTQKLFIGMNRPIAQQEFLTKKLFVIKDPDAFCGSLRPKINGELNVKGRRVTPILPIKSEMLSELNVSDLNKRITFEKTEKGIKVTLRIPSGIETTQEYIEREEGVEPLSESREIVEIDNVPVLEIWPNFRKSDWQVYYTYFTSPVPDMLYAVPYGTHISQQTVGNSSNIEKEITKTSHFPEVMVCKYKDTSDYEEAGILLISVPDPLPDGERTWNIGIDFGTSGTTVYRNNTQDQQSVPYAIEFVNHLLQVTESGVYRERLYDDFFSPKPEPEQTPFLSFFQYFSENKGTLEPLLNGHIHFVSNYQAFPTAQQIFTDLKWSPHADDRIRARVFLEQLCLQCAAEAATERVRKINWQFSYPIAFSEDDIGGFRQIWQRITETCSTVTGLQRGEVSSEPESIAAAKFFASTRQSKDATGAFATGAVCIDIGGETSDISIWQYNKLYWQASLRLAGRRVLLDILKENPEFLENFDVNPSDIKLLKDASKKKTSDFYAQADAWIAESINSRAQNDRQNWWQHLEIYTGEPQVKTFVQLIALGISGLLYYIGLILKRLSQTENFERRMPSVYIGGNGARILHWLANGKFESDEISKTRLKQILLDASGFDTDLNRFDLEISKSPKEEAAYGLVQAETFLDWAQDQLGKTDVLAGETFIENGEKRAWTEILTPERLASGLDTTEELGRIRDFVESFNKSGWSGEKITLDQRTHDFILAQLQNTFQKFRNDTPENLRIEPLFILALKFLLEWKTNQWHHK